MSTPNRAENGEIVKKPSLIIPTLGQPHLRDMVASIDIPVRLCIIANGGTDWDWLPDDAWLIELPHNIGYAAAVNLGIKCDPTAPFWLFANDDIVLAPGDLQRLIDTEGYGWVGINDWSCQKLMADTVDRIVRRLEGVVIARTYSLLEYNIPRSALAEAEAITPGFNSPTISGLEDADWCAVRVMVRRGDVHGIMERLDAIGASAIVETFISNCRL